MNKKLTIVLIILLSFIALALGGLLTLLISNDFKFENIFNRQSEKLIDSNEYETINNIYIDSNTADVYIKYSENDKVKVELYSDNAKSHDISLDGEDLKIELKEKNSFFFSKQARIIVYVPSEYANKINIANKTGDIESESLNQASFIIKLSTGDVKIKKADTLDITTSTGDIKVDEASTIKVKCSTGDIKLGKVTNSLDLKTTTGDIKIKDINLNEDGEIKTTTGDIRIDSINNVYVEASTKTGDVKINNNDRFADHVLNISATTGDIKVG